MAMSCEDKKREVVIWGNIEARCCCCFFVGKTRKTERLRHDPIEHVSICVCVVVVCRSCDFSTFTGEIIVNEVEFGDR